MFPQSHLLKSALAFAIIFIFFHSSPSSADNVSTTGEQFLEIPTGVRGAGMGGMFVGVADDVSTLFWNTAGLAQLDQIEINFLHVSYFADTDYEFAGLAWPLAPGSTIGIGASFDFVPSFNSTNNPSATPGSADDLAIALGYGQTFGDNFAFGIGGKFITSNLVTYSATGEGIDAGLLLYTKNKDLTLGLSVQNVGQISNYAQYSAQEELPLDYRAGLVYRLQPEKPTHFLVGVDFEKPIDGDAIIHTGAEFWLGIQNLSVALRGGYSFDTLNQDLGNDVGASLGAGIRLNGLEFDYALVPYGLLGDTQRFSLTYRFEANEKSVAQQAAKSPAVEIKPQLADYKTGTLKEAMFELKPQARTDIKNWSLQISDPKGNVLRTYTGQGVPPKQISWDGRDNNGNVVSGGIFANYNFKTVDSGGQQIEASQPIFKVAQISPHEMPLLASASVRPHVFVAPSLPEGLRLNGRSGTMKIPSVSFGENNYDLDPAYFNYLDEIAARIRQYPNCRVYIEGHAYDEGSEKDEMMISQNRADVVLRYLVEKGKVSPDNLYSRGHGSSAPLDTSDTEEARSKNRRVDIVILAK